MAYLYACLAVFYVGLAFVSDTPLAVTCNIFAALCWTFCLALKVTE